MNASSQPDKKRKSGLKIVGDVTWGSHFCQFYETKEDLLDVLVPYFRAGLEANEFCMWVTSEPLSAEEAKAALGAVVPDLKKRIAGGQMEILDYRQWYVLNGKFNADRVLQGWVDRLEAALKRGFEGLRLTGSTFWLEKSLWKNFSDYEAAVDSVIGKYRMLALCTYSLSKCGAFEVMDVVRNHQFALIRQGKRWEMLQSMQRAAAESALREVNERLRTQSEQLQAANEELDAQAEELAAQTEGLRTANEELAARAEELRAANEELQAQQEELQSQAEELLEAEQALRQMNEELEHRVAARTADVSKAHETVRAERQRFNDVLETLPAYLVLLTPDYHVPFANRFFRERFGESHGQRCFEYLFHRTEPCEICDTYKVLKTNAPHRWEWTGPDGRTYDVYDFPFTDTDGSPLIMEMGIDITEGKRAEAERRTAERLKLLSDTAANLLAAEDPQAVIDDLCRRVTEYLDCQAFFNFLVDERTGRLRLNACAGIPEKERKKIEWLDSDATVRGCVARDGKRIIAEHIPDSDDERTALVKSYGIKAYACHPILAGARVLGTLSFGTKTRETFAEDEIDLMKTVTDLVAIAVQRQQVQQALRESEQRYRSLFERMNEGFGLHEIVCDDEGRPCDFRFLDVNPAFEQLTGLKRENIVGRLISEILPNVEPYWVQTFGQVVLTGEPAHLEQYSAPLQRYYDAYAYRPAPGQFAVVFMDVTQRRHMDTELRRLNEALEEKVAERTLQLTTTVDRLQDEVARRVLAEGKLRKHSQMLEGFFQHTITPLAFLDRRFNFVRVNEAYARADGKDPQHFVGKNHFELYPHEENQAIFERVVRTKQPYRTFARPFIYPYAPERGTTYWNWQLTPLLNSAGEVQSLVLNLEDVTEQQKAYQELEHRTRQLQHLAMELSQAEDRERKRLAEILHDDLQQILAAAKFHLGILSGRIKGDESARELTGQLNEMLKDAIDTSRSLSHELSPAVLYQGDLGETFEWLAQELQAKHGLMVHVEAHGRVDSPSEALKPFLYRTAQEMLFNVVKHARVHEARLRIKRTRGQLRLTISDQGKGFDPKTLGRTAGFGLLSIRERVELLGGRMKIWSAPNRGSTFLIAVPDPQEAELAEAQVVQTDSRTWPAKRKHPEPKSEERLRVLLVDDHKVMREGLASLLDEQPDMDVVGQAGNGREAVDLAHKLQPHIIIMDASMPVMPGDEATRQIKLHLPKIRVIALSMFDEPQMSRKMRRAGAEAYLLKTAPSEELLAAIRGMRAGA